MDHTGDQSPCAASIREFRPADFPRLLEIDALCFEPGIAYTRLEMAFYVYDRRSKVCIADRAGSVVGFAIGSLIRNQCGHLITIDVLEQERHIGTGTALLTELHGKFVVAGVILSVLEVAAENLPAQRFYEKFGYRRRKILRGYYGAGRDAYFMSCRL